MGKLFLLEGDAQEKALRIKDATKGEKIQELV